jgi:hypothetical protein
MHRVRGSVPVAVLLALVPARAVSARSNVGDAAGGTAVAAYRDDVRLPPDPHGIAWHQVGGAVTRDELITEWVPQGETDLDWTQIITIKTMARTRDPAAIVQGAIGLMRGICGRLSVVETPRRQQLGDVQTLGMPVPAFDVTDMLVTCQDPDRAALGKRLRTQNVQLRRYELTWYSIIQGERQNFIVQRAWHGDDIDATSPLGSNESLEEWKHWLDSVTLVRSRVKP